MAKVILEFEDSDDDIILTVKFIGGIDKENATPAQQLAASLCTSLNETEETIDPKKN